jgi:hypothetical protein
VGLAFVLGPLGCTIKGGGDEGGDEASSEATTSEATTSETTGGDETTSGSETTGTAESAEGSETTAAPVNCEGSPDYTATAEVLDEGLGPTGAPVTITNCSGEAAYVYQDCCYGATYQLERKDTADGPWRTSTPSFECDCGGPIEPLVIEPGSSIVVETNPAMFDSEPICQDPYSAIYRWTFLVGPDPDCPECWQTVPTNEFSWYCEG